MPPSLVVGHRGSPQEAPENTLASFRLALSQGAQMVEMDVQLSQDGIPVVIHDFDAIRISGGTSQEVVAQSTLEQLRKVDAGALFPAYQGEPIPTLEEVLAELCPQIPVNLELKLATPHCRPLCWGVAEVLKKLGVSRRVLITSFFHGALPVIRRFCPEVVTGRLFYEASTGPLYPDDEAEILQEPIQPARPELPFRGRVLVMEQSMVDRALVERVQRAQGSVLVYTVNEDADMRRCLEMGVDAIISNRPGRLAQMVGLAAGQQ